MAQKGFIFKKSGAWFLRYRDDVMVNGQVQRKQKCKRLADVCDQYRTKKDLEGLRDEILGPLNSGKQNPESTMLAAEFAEEHWLPWARLNCKPSTVAGYETVWKTYLAPHLQKISLRDYRKKDAVDLLAEIQRHHAIGHTTMLHCRSRLTAIFTLAENKGLLDWNKVKGAMLPKRAETPSETHATTPDEIMAILDTLEKAGELRAQVAVGLMFFAGLRPGEARGASWQDFDGKRLFVRRSVWHTHTTTPKTEDAASPVPVIETLAEIIGQLREADGNPSTGPILRGPSGKAANLDNLSKRVLIPLLKAAGLEWHGWYSLRRGVATTLAGLTRDGMASKGLLRHTNLATTTRHYVKDVPENTQAAMILLESLFSRCSPANAAKPN
jgi:integrase